MRSKITLTRSHYVITIDNRFVITHSFEQLFSDICDGPLRRSCGHAVPCSCHAPWTVKIRRKRLSYERALELQRHVRFACSLPQRKRLARAPASQAPHECHLLKLPNELLTQILVAVCVQRTHFRLRDVGECAATCKRLFGVAKTSYLWRGVMRRLTDLKPNQSWRTKALIDAYELDPQTPLLPWKHFDVPTSFGIVRSELMGGVAILRIVRDAASDVILEYTRGDKTFRRYDLKQFGWRLSTTAPYQTFYADVDEIVVDAETGRHSPRNCCRESFMRAHTHQL